MDDIKTSHMAEENIERTTQLIERELGSPLAWHAEAKAVAEALEFYTAHSPKTRRQLDFQASNYGACDEQLTLIFVKKRPAPWLRKRIAFRNQPGAKKVKYCVFLDYDPQNGRWVGPPVLC